MYLIILLAQMERLLVEVEVGADVTIRVLVTHMVLVVMVQMDELL
jgi:hypothetical protein